MGGYISTDNSNMSSIVSSDENDVLEYDILGKVEVEEEEGTSTFNVIGNKINDLEKKVNVSKSVINVLRENIQKSEKKNKDLIKEKRKINDNYKELIVKYERLLFINKLRRC